MPFIALFVAAAWLAYSNGANDNFKGVATIYGSGTAGFRQALAWTTLATGLGCAVSVFAAGQLVAAFSGRGIIPDDLAGTLPALTAVGLGAALTISLATWMGLPTSTTHALMGALLGVGLAGARPDIDWGKLLYAFAAPMLISPVLAFLFSAAGYPVLRQIKNALGITRRTCLCIGNQAPVPVSVQRDGTVVLAGSNIRVDIDRMENCEERYVGKYLGAEADRVLKAIHFLSGGAVCFSRAVNDTPKIAALLLMTGSLSTSWGLVWIAAAMLVGGWLNSRRVADTMSLRITDLSEGQGLTANLVTAGLVLFASTLGVPVSTTHVSVGSIFGIGAANHRCNGKVAGEILAAWVTTLPLAALIGGLLFFAVTRI